MRVSRSAILFVFLAVTTVSISRADYSWSPDFAYAGFNGRVCDAVVFEGDLVVTGLFGANGETRTPGVARWDGTQWLAMGDPGFTTEGGFALAVYQGELHASGHRGGTFGYVSKWDGTQWIDVATFDFQGAAFNMATRMIEYDSLLVVTGFFTVQPNGVFISGWDGSGWVHLGDTPSLNPIYAGQQIHAMVEYDGDLFVGGEFFESIGGAPMNGLARWDGAIWSGVEGRSAPGQPLVEGIHWNGFNGTGSALSVHDGKLAIGGAFLTAGDLPAVNVVTFDATTELWENIGSAPDYVEELSSNGLTLLATVRQPGVLGFELHEYDGSVWSSVATSDGPVVGGFFSDMVAYGGDHVLVGDFHDTGGTATPSVATWDGTGIGTLANPTTGLGLPRAVVAMTQHDGELIAVLEHGRGLQPHGVVAFDGSAWHYLARWTDTDIRDVVSDGLSLYASGTFDEINGLNISRIARWDGTTWSAMGSNPPYHANLEMHNGAVYAGTALDVSYFDGAAWQSISVNQEGGDAMVSYGGDLIASGGAKPLSLWDGSTWTPLTGTNGGSLNDQVAGFAVFEGDLVMAGYFTDVDGTPAQVAVWDGTTLTAWAPAALPDPPTFVNSVATYDGNVVLAALTGAGLWISPGQGSPWEVLAGGVDSFYPVLETFDGKLYVGGDFSVVGDQTGGAGILSSSIACLGPTPTAVTEFPMESAAPVAFPNPFNPTTTIRYSVPRGSAVVRVVIHDVRGRAVRTLLNARVAGGRRSIVWDGRDDDGGRLASGTYFYRVDVGSEVFTGKLTMLK